MKIYYLTRKSKKHGQTDQLTVLASAKELRRIAEFFGATADLLDKHGKAFGHEHFQDFEKGSHSGFPDIIIGREE